MTESEEYDRKDPSIKDGMNLHMGLIFLAAIVLGILPVLPKVYDYVRRQGSERVQLIGAEVDAALKRSMNYPH